MTAADRARKLLRSVRRTLPEGVGRTLDRLPVAFGCGCSDCGCSGGGCSDCSSSDRGDREGCTDCGDCEDCGGGDDDSNSMRSDAEPIADGGWEVADSPTDRALHAVAHAADAPYACGEGGIVLRRGEGWETVIERGPGVAANTLRTVAATDDGDRIWFAGDSGALGVYDVAEPSLGDYSAPEEKTSTWESIAVTGEAGEERLRIANGSGEVLEAACENGCPTWGEVVEPGGGSTLPALDADEGAFYAADTSGGVYRSDGEWDRIGIDNAEVNFFDVHAGDDGRLLVAGADGIAYEYDPVCRNWTPQYAGEGDLRAIDASDGRVVAAATGGRCYERTSGIEWRAIETGTEESLADVALAPDGPDIAVGAGGTILERSD
ncbi:hypothetical protein [Saliphagus sp. LR7]|uniref:WD40/YVTN/BNR-like repeat-containing protein n=1 Tax=Saliphagus sp. LR7 TaxID=2282654 RepID=UPI0018E57A52|nr:hypothetical protein [Saliphagus sp. LR7]